MGTVSYNNSCARPPWLVRVAGLFLVLVASTVCTTAVLTSPEHASSTFAADNNSATRLLLPAQMEQSSADVVIYSERDAHSGIWLEYRAPVKRVQMTKPWAPEREPPPFTIAAAVAIAKKSRKPENPRDLDVLHIELSVVDAGGQYRWYYVIRLFDTTAAYGSTPPAASSVLALMDGSIVKPAKPGEAPDFATGGEPRDQRRGNDAGL